ncbi:IclR family transcriptional regulator [Jiella sonneratiae]|uniref:IclR family transcriptional regulator n=1 Tax=Jiella sonneratiae TaxID=2816856 RepID=A0ABS3J1G0_9HYPH|nr:IclR family transcriptional regulator [Jiella sonneratiae]MBO0903512.1 IclR family transcriptional regulator [Jiella sonneratiae]
MPRIRKAAAAGAGEDAVTTGRPPAAPAASGRSGGIQSLVRAGAILDTVARHPGGIALADLSAAVGLHTSTAFALIQTLVALGYIDQGERDRRYRVGSRLFAIAAGALDEAALLNLASPVLADLSAATGEASHLAVRSGRDIVVVARKAATGLLQLSDRGGAVRPAHATAIGKVLLSAMPEEDFERLLPTLSLERFTPDTITEPEALRREIAAIRASGIAHDRRELDPDVSCIAMLVHDFAGRPLAAIGVSGPIWRMAAHLQERSDQLRAAARRLSAALGHADRDGAS